MTMPEEAMFGIQFICTAQNCTGKGSIGYLRAEKPALSDVHLQADYLQSNKDCHMGGQGGHCRLAGLWHKYRHANHRVSGVPKLGLFITKCHGIDQH